MSARIIIEKDGERYVANDLTAIFKRGRRWVEIENKSGDDYVASDFTKLPNDNSSEVIAKLEAENAKLRDEIQKVIAARNELLDLNRDCCDENDKLREVMKDLVIVAKNRIPTIPTVFECEAIGKAQDVINGISRKDEDISRKGGAA